MEISEDLIIRDQSGNIALEFSVEGRSLTLRDKTGRESISISGSMRELSIRGGQLSVIGPRRKVSITEDTIRISRLPDSPLNPQFIDGIREYPNVMITNDGIIMISDRRKIRVDIDRESGDIVFKDEPFKDSEVPVSPPIGPRKGSKELGAD